MGGMHKRPYSNNRVYIYFFDFLLTNERLSVIIHSTRTNYEQLQEGALKQELIKKLIAMLQEANIEAVHTIYEIACTLIKKKE